MGITTFQRSKTHFAAGIGRYMETLVGRFDGASMFGDVRTTLKNINAVSIQPMGGSYLADNAIRPNLTGLTLMPDKTGWKVDDDGNFEIGRTLDTGHNRGVRLTPNAATALATWQAVTAGDFSYKLDGGAATDATPTNLSTAKPSLTIENAALLATLAAIDDGQFRLTVGTTARNVSVDFANYDGADDAIDSLAEAALAMKAALDTAFTADDMTFTVTALTTPARFKIEVTGAGIAGDDAQGAMSISDHTTGGGVNLNSPDFLVPGTGVVVTTLGAVAALINAVVASVMSFQYHAPYFVLQPVDPTKRINTIADPATDTDLTTAPLMGLTETDAIPLITPDLYFSVQLLGIN